MDPTACLRRLLTALDEGDNEETSAAASDLRVWLVKGGFVPRLDTLSPTQSKALIEWFCALSYDRTLYDATLA